MVNSTTEDSLSECCSKCGRNESANFSTRDVAITACSSFLAGIALVLLILFIIKLKRKKKLCFKRKEEPFKGKFEGASKKATLQVLKKHTLERCSEEKRSVNEDKIEQNEEQREEVTTAESAVVEKAVVTTVTETRASEELSERKSECAESENEANEKVRSKSERNSNETDQTVSVDMQKDINNHVKVVEENANEDDILKPRDKDTVSSHLYEKSRGSSVYEHDDLILQNANFRISALSNI